MNQYLIAPDIRHITVHGMLEWVTLCMNARKNGARPDEIRRMGKLLMRLAPALSDAAAPALAPAANFEQMLNALQAPNHG